MNEITLVQPYQKLQRLPTIILVFMNELILHTLKVKKKKVFICVLKQPWLPTFRVLQLLPSIDSMFLKM